MARAGVAPAAREDVDQRRPAGAADHVGDHRDRLARQRLAQVFGRARQDQVGAELRHPGMLGLGRHGDRPRAAALRELDQRAAHPARGAGNQNRVSRLHGGAVQHAFGRGAGAREGRKFGVGQVGLHHGHIAHVALRVLGEPAVCFRPEIPRLVRVLRVRRIAQPGVDHDPPADQAGIRAFADGNRLAHDVRALDAREARWAGRPSRRRPRRLPPGHRRWWPPSPPGNTSRCGC